MLKKNVTSKELFAGVGCFGFAGTIVQQVFVLHVSNFTPDCTDMIVFCTSEMILSNNNNNKDFLNQIAHG